MKTILFVCTGNAARSQMAEGLLKNLKNDIVVLSAGTKPEGVSSKAIKVMKEIGLDISDHHSKHLEDVDWKNSDFAITLCGSANEICVSMPWPEKCKRLHWPIKDPETDDEFRKARDEINQRIVNSLSDF
tara:strand:+ start:151 stop:540 length:390 start_codon:yes stop_codon:yes gene_type:complete